MPEGIKPVVVISQCLELSPCRYNGQVITDSFVKRLAPYVTFVPVCPEVEIGLGVPRDPVRLVTIQGQTRLMQPATGADLSDRMQDFAAQFLARLGEVDGFLFKSRSPSCGIRDAKVYPALENAASTGKQAGLFAGKVLERFANLAVEDEGRLNNFRIREHFLTKLFTLARFRLVKATNKIQELVHFHTIHKFLFMAYNQKECRILGRIVANPEKAPFPEVITRYDTHLKQALSYIPRYTSSINVCMHALGYFSKELSAQEKRFFLDTLERYRQKKIPLSTALSILQSWIIRFDQPYLQDQLFFAPYPEELRDISDSGKGRDF